jgi:membrane protein YqaA with SNARE-associated domain
MGARDRQRLWDVAAALWGFAEATLFFLVPDVLLTAAAVGSLRRGLRAAGFALAGAVAGGVVVMLWAGADPEGAARMLLAVPGVSEALVERAQGLVEGGFLAGMTIGSLSGVPYKIFAVEAAGAGLGLGAFAAMSLPARGLRFLVAVLLAHAIGRLLPADWGKRARLGLLAGFWAVFYAFYLAVMGW